MIKAARRLHLTAGADTPDVVTLDIPLFIRLLEVAREELKTDAELHNLVERVLQRQRESSSSLTMADYPYLYMDKGLTPNEP
jgi:hypothetical protein